MNDQPPHLGESKTEVIARTTATTIKAIANAIPGAGLLLGPAVEIALNEIIPGYRLDRIEDFLRYLDQKANHQRFEEWVKTEDGAEHFEESIRQAARSKNSKRREHIAIIIQKILENSHEGYFFYKASGRNALHLIDSISDDEIIILFYYYNNDRENGWDSRSYDKIPETIKTMELKEYYESHLISLCLLHEINRNIGSFEGGLQRKLRVSNIGKNFIEFIQEIRISEESP